MLYNFIGSVLNFLIVKRLKNLEVIGKEHEPDNHEYLVTCNHESYNEIVLLGVALLPNQIHFMAKQELFENKLFGKFLSALNAFPVNRENPGPSTLKIPVKLLNSNKTVGIFPSGHRTKEEVPLKRGAATIAMLAKKPILPAAYVGPTKIIGMLTGKAYIKFGEPIDTTTFPEGMKRQEKVEYLTNLIGERTKQLQKELNEYVKTK
ncbi:MULTISPECIES: 1-acyl-sn-glycerol-3-phosphate acyltransferase [unclassified Staphylococcus]|uniref:lysophospholipid acyltransferase family protein n=1 Tax=unclassified Staphylococcus TaxID=91994 RepID=UPI0021D35C29|nr:MULTISPECIES: 1-acyl-sn-glycerol-3-phosphate acyltransferase [unclassified Staphylococcus]UXR68859.1 1-acyl-sn-glycerol-3-phosphate acyltransferase [Staphylococcus sp. IVB6246]UXR70916.1 1-acyl-sn-glycerol-3-phosphate acyltransferase [Staphylococcus sp. IVB6240]UXR73146.1 1-acyl-sn-glycerol-3-phosphate acyltransferase [Staphylococcus sp. IVB6238]UXR75442.1 1-acyl-sn-glycerol-3-phosphate acyltransferase [Staphylococcus sp. IVB6233]UXR79645.1 1-acyl-sn-glycerol-3-phosphate acyltransferase [St